MAAGVSFLLWRDLENRADMVSNDDGESHKGDWFLSLSNFSGRDDDDDSEGDSDSNMEKFASRTRARLYFHLSLFGLLNLGAHGGYILSNQAPFLGASAAIINVHNTLACVSALMKEEGSKDLVLPLRLFKRKKGLKKLTPAIFNLGALVASLRCVMTIVIIKDGVSLSSALVNAPGDSTAAIVTLARELSLKVATVARLSLFAGISRAVSLSVTDDGDGVVRFRKHPFFAGLSGIIGLACLGTSGAMLFDSFGSSSFVSAKLVIPIAWLMFGLFAMYDSVSGIGSFRQEQKPEVA